MPDEVPWPPGRGGASSSVDCTSFLESVFCLDSMLYNAHKVTFSFLIFLVNLTSLEMAFVGVATRGQLKRQGN